MKPGRFASITSNLLVRKGEARPWQMPGSEVTDLRTVIEPVPPHPPRERAVSEDERLAEADYWNWKRVRDAEAAAADHASEPSNGQTNMQTNGHANAYAAAPSHGYGHAEHEHDEHHSKRVMLRLSPAEYERLGIIGVKREMTRQQLLRQAIDHYLAAAKTEYQAACGCLSGEACASEC
jgi:hypothetical protein